jgi:AcrR family transcriptional regulator
VSPRPKKTRPKSALTRERILRAALARFRKKGFDATTMRDIAEAAGTSLGAAYYYFPSKEALVLAHWEEQMAEHERLARLEFEKSSDLTERLRAVFQVRLALMKNDRKLLTGLFRTLGDTQSTVSVFAPDTSELRQRGLTLIKEALDVPEVPESIRDEAALALWTLMLGFVLYFIHDDSSAQKRTSQLIDGAVEALCPLIPWLASPMAAPLRSKVLAVLADAGLWQGPKESD